MEPSRSSKPNRYPRPRLHRLSHSQLMSNFVVVVAGTHSAVCAQRRHPTPRSCSSDSSRRWNAWLSWSHAKKSLASMVNDCISRACMIVTDKSPSRECHVDDRSIWARHTRQREERDERALLRSWLWCRSCLAASLAASNRSNFPSQWGPSPPGYQLECIQTCWRATCWYLPTGGSFERTQLWEAEVTTAAIDVLEWLLMLKERTDKCEILPCQWMPRRRAREQARVRARSQVSHGSTRAAIAILDMVDRQFSARCVFARREGYEGRSSRGFGIGRARPASPSHTEHGSLFDSQTPFLGTFRQRHLLG